MDQYYNRVFILNPLNNAQDANLTLSLSVTGQATMNVDTLALAQGYAEFTVSDEIVETVNVTVDSVSDIENNSGLVLETLQTFVPIELSFNKRKPAIISEEFVSGINTNVIPLALYYSEVVNDLDASLVNISLDGAMVNGSFELFTVMNDSTNSEATQLVFTPDSVFELGRCYDVDTTNSSLRGTAANDPVLAQTLSICAPQSLISVPQKLYLLEGITTSLNLLLDEQLDSGTLTGNTVVARVENQDLLNPLDSESFVISGSQFEIAIPTHTGTDLADGQQVLVSISNLNTTNEISITTGNRLLLTVLQANGDFDSDGIPNGIEFTLADYDPNNVDSDGDGINDGDEDVDGDGLNNSAEIQANTQLDNSDSDNDGLNDFDEVIIHQSDPNLVDTDLDGISDFIEVISESDPTNPLEAFVDPFYITGMQVTPLTITRDLATDSAPVQLAVTVNFEDQGRIETVDITQQSNLLSFDTANEQIATVNTTGLISLIASGTTEITVTFIENPVLTETVSLALSLTQIDPITMEQEPNNSLETAQNIDTYFNLIYSPDIGDETTNTSTVIPHVSISGTGDGSYDYYQFTVVTADSLAVFDIDDGNFDSYIRLYNQSGTLIGSNDDASISKGQGGSSSGAESFYAHIFSIPGEYTLKVSRYSDSVIQSGDSYTLHISLENGGFADTDNDGIADDWEDEYGLDKNDPTDAQLDNDSDGLNNLSEFKSGTNPLIADTDNDGLSDSVEINTSKTNPLLNDTDGDTLSDFDEYYTLKTSPFFADTDGDGINDAQDTIDDWLYFFNGEAVGDYFGSVVSDLGDVNNDGVVDVIVGAPLNNNNGSNSGSVTIFSGATGEELYRFYGEFPEDNLGRSVSDLGDVNNDGFADVIVGSQRQNMLMETSIGVATIYSGADGSVLHRLYSGSSFDGFAESVSALGDVNSDGFADVIVGAPQDNTHDTYSGSAMIFSGATGEVLHSFYGEDNGDEFGRAVSDAGDVNNDGFADVIVGAPQNDTNGRNAGSAIIFSGATGEVLKSFYGEYYYENFGYSVSDAGDVNKDGVTDVIIGAPGEGFEVAERSMRGAQSVTPLQSAERIQTDNGNATIFSGATGEVIYSFNGEAEYDQFGISVSGLGDINNDGYADVIVGAPENDTNGSATIFSGVDGSTLLTIVGQSDYAGLGISVSALADIDNDGYPEVIVGTYKSTARIIAVNKDWDGDGLVLSADLHPYIDDFLDSDGDGLMDVLELAIGTAIDNVDTDGDTLSDFNEYHSLTSDPLLVDTDGDGTNDAADTFDNLLYSFNGEDINDNFGDAVSDAGDVNKDGVVDIIVGAYGNDTNGNDSGSATILSGATGEVLYQFYGESPNDELGRVVSGAGDVNNDGYDDVIVSSRSNQVIVDTSVRVAVIFSGADGSILHRFSSASNDNDTFAGAISAAGDVNNDGYADVIVGASRNDTNGQYSGSATIFSGATGEVVRSFYGEAAYSYFGSSVSDAGDVNNDGFGDVIVGASNNSVGSATIYSGATGEVLHRFSSSSNNGYTNGFGSVISDVGDVNNDGFDDVIVGAPYKTANVYQTGSATIYSGGTGEVLHNFEGVASRDYLGSSVSGLGDVNNDGFADVIVGVSGKDNNAEFSGGTDSGSVIVFSGFDGSRLFTISGQIEDAQLGSAVSYLGDINSDGSPEVAVGTLNNTAHVISIVSEEVVE
ncbi:hypothetical protein L3081_19970 [Colwellia sp. MSW7]|uniref:FG-GAP repeat protein n=1 Tax=Colwellia maritima TaxID=2912588 RepID=A0ABS9X6Z1_9GAMM|nr:integrin alpha [Colwellia maritima]MCI2285236.1 hypothetical protein [Colwellia maritima]